MARVKVEMGINNAKVIAGIRQVERSLESLKAIAAEAFAAIAAATFIYDGLKELISKTVEAADSIANLSDKLGIVPEQLQVMQRAAAITGVAFDSLADSIERAQELKDRALSGDRDALAIYKYFGMTDKNKIRNTSAADFVNDNIGDKVKSGNYSVTEIKDAIGKGYKDIIPYLKINLKDVEKDLREVGGIMSTKTVASVKILNEQFTLLGNLLVTVFAPALVWTINKIEDAADDLIKFVFNKTGEHPIWDNVKKYGLELGGGAAAAAMTGGTGTKMGLDLGEMADKLTSATATAYDPGAEADKFLAAQKKLIADLTYRLTHPDQPTSDAPVNKLPKPYSDSLTSVGNMLGASFGKMGEVTNLLTVSKEHVSIARHQTELLEKLVMNTAIHVGVAATSQAWN